MGMSTHVVGFREPDEKYAKMLAIYEACEAANVAVPDEVLDFFEHKYLKNVEKNGMEVSLRDAEKEWSNEYALGIEVDVSKLPKDLKIIRFYNSW